MASFSRHGSAASRQTKHKQQTLTFCMIPVGCPAMYRVLINFDKRSSSLNTHHQLHRSLSLLGKCASCLSADILRRPRGSAAESSPFGNDSIIRGQMGRLLAPPCAAVSHQTTNFTPTPSNLSTSARLIRMISIQVLYLDSNPVTRHIVSCFARNPAKRSPLSVVLPSFMHSALPSSALIPLASRYLLFFSFSPLSPLESALPQNAPLTPVESALPKHGT